MYEELVERLRAGTYTLYELSFILPKAADAIEELQQTVDHYKGCSDDWYKEACDYKAMWPRWIPVTERLPENGRVLCRIEEVCENHYAPGSVIFEMDSYLCEGHYVKCGKNKGWYKQISPDVAKGISGVTHWMPLPEPPKEERR